jgi:hypothetical protein
MTVFGWDTSSWDATPASRDGIDVFTCKLTDGDHFYENPTFAAKMNAMRGFGVTVMGAYHVLWGNKSIANQVAWYIQMLDARIPWWRDFEYFICQSDCEPFYSGQTPPTVPQINEFHDRVIDASGGKIDSLKNEAYAPKWVYGSALTGLKYRWWQSDYGSNPTGHYPDIYPGDSSPRWTGPIPAFFLQYGSNAIIAGQTTSDANAFRGTLDDLHAALGGDMTAPFNDAQMAQLKAAPWSYTGRGFANNDLTPEGNISTLRAFDEILTAARAQADAFAAIDASLADIKAAIVALALSTQAAHTHQVTGSTSGAPVSGSTGPAVPTP